MATIPSKQLHQAGNLDYIQTHLSEREIGINTDDMCLYFKYNNNFIPVGLFNVEDSGWVSATDIEHGVSIKLLANSVTGEITTIEGIQSASDNYMIPLISKDGTGADMKILLGRLALFEILKGSGETPPEGNVVKSFIDSSKYVILRFNVEGVTGPVDFILQNYNSYAQRTFMTFTSTLTQAGKCYVCRYATTNGGTTWSVNIDTLVVASSESIAPEYDSSVSGSDLYPKDSLVYRVDSSGVRRLYRALVDNEGGPWESSIWEETSLDLELKRIRQEIST